MIETKERTRAKPGAKGKGDYYHILVRPKELFVIFRTHDVGDPGGVQRITGKRAGGSWSTQAWLVSKEIAHVARGTLVGDTKAARNLLKSLGNTPEHIEGDIFKLKEPTIQ